MRLSFSQILLLILLLIILFTNKTFLTKRFVESITSFLKTIKNHSIRK